MVFHELETERLLLKNISYEDREFILKQFSNDDVNRYLFDAEPLKTLEDADELIKPYVEPEPRMQHSWVLVLKETGEKIGTCGFHWWYEKEHRAEVGYDIKRSYWGKGLMSEAMKAILTFGKNEMKLKKINAKISVDNAKSRQLAERCGFTFRGETETMNFRGKEYLHNIYTLDL